MSESTTIGKDFIREIVETDVKAAKYPTVITRFPPEPNGYLHIGHAKSIVLNFGVAQEYGGRCHLRMDDTNPETEKMEYVGSIIEMIHWLGYDWGEHLYYASDYFDQMYAYAVALIKNGRAYVDSQSEDEIRQTRGTVMEAGVESPYRNRSVEENLDLFTRMRAGAFPDGAHVLRAKGDMSSTNMKMRDPLLYRIKHASHYRTGDTWCIYPMYDYAHPISDAIEGISHSLCTLEFDNNRAIYDWLMDNLWSSPRPYQHEFARMELDYTVVSKRKLLQLVNEQYVSGWDDPRMPTLAGMRRRGVTPVAIRTFAEKVGVAKTENRIDIALLEWAIRNDLNFSTPRRMAVLNPLKVVIINWNQETEWLTAANFPHDVLEKGGGDHGSRQVPFTRELYIEQDDFAENPPKGWKRLVPGGEVRLRAGYIIRCDEVVKDAAGHVVELRCTYDPATKSGQDTSGRKATAIHWVSAAHGVPAEFRLYDRLFSVADPEADVEDFKQNLNPNSLQVVHGWVEAAVAQEPKNTRYQFERQGYFWQDPVDSDAAHRVFNRIVTLRDSWEAKTQPIKSAPALEKTAPKVEVQQPEANAEAVAWAETHGIAARQAEIMLAQPALAGLFTDALAVYPNAKALAGWITNDVNKWMKEGTAWQFNAAQLAKLAELVESGTITAAIGRQVLGEMATSGNDPETIITEKGLKPLSDTDALRGIAAKVLAENPNQSTQFRNGKTQLMGFFVGRVMKMTQGKADAKVVQDVLQELLQT